jgi:hypothetical protein
MKKTELIKLIKEEMNSFGIEPNLAFKIYDILKEEYPVIGKNETPLSFFHLINNGLKK